jgi:3-oxoacyl-[acyl-carrier protein] reductase
VSDDRRVALVSGSSRGIGKGIAAELARIGYRVAVTGRTADQVRATAAELDGEAFIYDLTVETGVAACVDDVLQRCGRLDVVVANLGSGRSVPAPLVPLDEVRRVFDLNFFSTIALCNHTVPRLPPDGAVVIIGSIAGCEALGAPVAYGAAKAAVLSYMKSLALHLAARGIRVNAVSPGNILFDGGSWDEKRKRDEAAVRDYVRANVPLDRFGTPADVGQAVAYVLQAPFMTGHNLIVDGGQTRRFV